MVNEPQLFEKLDGIIGPDDFYEQIYHGAALLLFKQYAEEGAVIISGTTKLFGLIGSPVSHSKQCSIY